MLFITLQSSILCEAIVSTGRGCLVSVIQEYNSIHVYIYIYCMCVGPILSAGFIFTISFALVIVIVN